MSHFCRGCRYDTSYVALHPQEEFPWGNCVTFSNETFTSHALTIDEVKAAGFDVHVECLDNLIMEVN